MGLDVRRVKERLAAELADVGAVRAEEEAAAVSEARPDVRDVGGALSGAFVGGVGDGDGTAGLVDVDGDGELDFERGPGAGASAL